MKRGPILQTLSALGLEECARSLRYRLAPGGVPKQARAGDKELSFFCTSPGMADEIAALGGERDVLESFLANVRKGETVWDVGANLGLYALFAATKTGPIFAFEPEATTCRLLQRNIDANALGNVTVMPYALGDTDGSALFFSGADGITTVSNLVPRDGTYRTERQGDAIQIRRADSVLAEHPDMAPHAIKVDVEGAELRVLRGFGESGWRTARMLLIEVHPELLPLHGATVDQVGQWLSEHGFAVTSESRRRKELHWLCERSQQPSAPSGAAASTT